MREKSDIICGVKIRGEKFVEKGGNAGFEDRD